MPNDKRRRDLYVRMRRGDLDDFGKFNRFHRPLRRKPIRPNRMQLRALADKREDDDA